MNQILYEDADIILLRKPAGIPSQTSRLREKDMVSILKNYRAGKQEEPYIALIHRLDQPVEGILLAAKTKEAAAELSRQSAEHRMGKYYRVIVYNRHERPLVQGEKGTLTDYLLKNGKTNCSVVAEKGTKGAKWAQLTYEVLRADEKLAELSVKLETGRHHQIRVQMANAGFPLAGDLKYGKAEDEFVQKAGGCIALCFVKISFLHPNTQKKMEFEIEPENPIFQLL